MSDSTTETIKPKFTTRPPSARPVARTDTIFDMQPRVFAQRMEKYDDLRRQLIGWIREELVEGIDFGRFHRRYPRGRSNAEQPGGTCDLGDRCEQSWHFTKPCLLKPGAEKITGMLRLRPTWQALREYELAAAKGVRIENVILRCELLDHRQRVVGEGGGARTLRQEGGDLNKALKMAKKSSLCDAVLGTAGLSEIFTQDLERLAEGEQGDLVDQVERCPVGPCRGQPLATLTDEQLEQARRMSDDPAFCELAADLLRAREEGIEPRPDDASAAVEREFTMTGAADAVRDAATLEDLERCWAAFEPRFRKALVRFYEKRKEELS